MATEDTQRTSTDVEQHPIAPPEKSGFMGYVSHPWFQILLISFICFCLPGIYNALSGIGGSGQVDSTVAANGNVALLSCTAATALFLAGPIFGLIGPRWSFMIGGWTYALYSGSLLCYNHTKNANFVIGSAAILGVGASFLWVTQGAIMTTYVPEAQKGRAIAVFWIIFNFGGGIGSLASFGLNYNSKSGTVSDSTYAAFVVIMVFGWALGMLICSPSKMRNIELREVGHKERPPIKEELKLAFRTITNWRVACMLPVFFCANVFYSYQQNNVNGYTFNIRSRSLNGALYWMAQMFGGLVMGAMLDITALRRKHRAALGWAVLFVTGMSIWGGGYAFEKWEDARLAKGLKQDVDYLDAATATGPIFLYIFYGCYDALWQSFSYWMIGSVSNSSAVAAILVGAYKTFQATGAAMAWRINALAYSGMTQLGMDWGLCIGALVIILPTVLTVSDTNVHSEEDLADKASTKGSAKDDE